MLLTRTRNRFQPPQNIVANINHQIKSGECSYYWLVRVRADLDGRAVRGARGAVRGQPLPQLRALPGRGHRRVPLLLRPRLPRAQVT